MRTTNFAEVFNGVLIGARNIHIAAYVQMTFCKVNKYFVFRRKVATGRIFRGGTPPPPHPHMSTKLAT